MSLSHFSSQDCPSQVVLCCSCVYLLGSVLLRWADPRNQVTGQLFWHRQAMKHVLACGGFSVWQLGFIWEYWSPKLIWLLLINFLKERRLLHGLCSHWRLSLFSELALRESDDQWVPRLPGFKWSNQGPGKEFQKSSSLIASLFQVFQRIIAKIWLQSFGVEEEFFWLNCTVEVQLP